jgi:4-amino-4-deoxy-L-arabinose transferase-like glycosyltransferase
MLPDPLHPAVVHFPMAFAVLLPISAVVALWAIRRGARPLHAWGVPLALAIALTGSSWVALETGEAQEDRVEAIVGEAPIHEHEEAAERFMLLSGIRTGREGLSGRCHFRIGRSPRRGHSGRRCGGRAGLRARCRAGLRRWRHGGRRGRSRTAGR